jgi:putative ABC transport system permease protein
MNIGESLRMSLHSMAANKMRTALTMLGIIIGVGAVIALLAAGAGAQAQVTEQFESLGSNLLVISPARSFFRGVSMGSSSSQTLTNDDVYAIASLANSVAAIAPEYSLQGQIVYGDKNTQTSVVGVTPEYLQVRDWTLDRGRFIDALDLTTDAKVAVLGSSVVDDLFGSILIDPVGKMIKINRQSYEVVGILKSKGASGIQSLDDQVFIPLTTAQVRFGGAGTRSLDAINVEAVSPDKMDQAQAELTAILRASHGLAATQADDFNIQNQTQILEMVAQTAGTFAVLLASIAAISLVVGGIGIMNIMLVSVTERTREIGIRKAVGARRRDILFQFLVEAVALSLVGGLIGVLAGYGGARIVTPMLGGSRAIVTASSVAMALGVSLAVGLFFGIYPASRASSLNPIDALRFE